MPLRPLLSPSAVLRWAKRSRHRRQTRARCQFFSARASKKAPLGPSEHCGRSEKLASHESRTSPSSSQTQSYLSPVMSIRTDSDLDGRVYGRLRMCAAPTHASGGARIYIQSVHACCLFEISHWGPGPISETRLARCDRPKGEPVFV